MVELKHVALTIDSKVHAVEFYEHLLQGKRVKEFEISSDLLKQIFSISASHDLSVMVFEVGSIVFEIFIVDDQQVAERFDHVCISVNDMHIFKKQCLQKGLKVSIIPKGEKELVFIQDFVGNLFEIKQKE